MSIRPVDISGMIQRTQDVSTVKQNEDNKPIVQQHNIQVKLQHQEDQLAHQVQHTQEKENEEYRYDAREKGNNSYDGNRKKKKDKKKENEDEGKVLLKDRSSSFDIKI